MLALPTRLMNEYVREMQMRLRGKNRTQKTISQGNFKRIRVRGNEVRITYKLRMTVRTPPSDGGTLGGGVLYTVSNGGADGGRTHGL